MSATSSSVVRVSTTIDGSAHVRRAEPPSTGGASILTVHITKGPGPSPAGIFEQAPRVIATLDDGSDVELFSFYAHERSFAPEEFIGLTVDDARRLKYAPGHQLFRPQG